MSLEVQPTQYIQTALFPAQVTVDGYNYGDRNKIFLTDNYFYVIQEVATPELASIVFSAPATREQFARPTNSTYTVITDEHIIEWHRAPNCGCGSRLRSVNPFIGIPHIAQKRVGE